MSQATRKRSSTARRKKTAAATRKSSGTARGGAAAAKRTGPRSTAGSAVAKGRNRSGGTDTLAAASATGALTPAQQRALAARELETARALGQVDRRLRGAAGIVAAFAAVFTLLALATFDVGDPGWSRTSNGAVNNSMGHAGAWIADVLLWIFGYMAYLLPLLLGVTAWLLVRPERAPSRLRAGYRPFAFMRIVGIVMMLLTASGLADLHMGVPEGALPGNTFGGGVLGMSVAWPLMQMLKELGTTMLLLALFLVALTLTFGTGWLGLVERVGEIVISSGHRLRSMFVSASEQQRERARIRAADKVREERRRGGLGDDPLLLDPNLIDAQPRRGLGAALEMVKSRAQAETADHRHSRMDEAFARALSNEAAPKSAVGSSAKLALDRSALDVPTGIVDGVIAANSGAKGQKAAQEPAVEVKAESQTNPTPPLVPQAKAPPSVAAQKQAEAAEKKKIAIRNRAADTKQPSFKLDTVGGLPPLSLLDAPKPQRLGFSNEELESLSRLLESILADFKITADVVAVQPGPVITRFEIEPAAGTKASRITGLSQDIARSMSLDSVRVVEVISGKSTIGIEVPNEYRETVQLSELFQTPQWNKTPSVLTLALGKDISGQPLTADLGKMPHLLVAGTTGSGKSVGVNSMLVSLLYKATPADVRLILIDPKMLELSIYDGIPHLLTPVVTDMKDATNALRWCVMEMERRYMLMSKLKVRKIDVFNKTVRNAIKSGSPIVDPLYDQEKSLNPSGPPPTLEPLPYIVVVVDEFADMMMQVGKKAEELIARIAQKARAAGIHLILATQRPSVDVITGLIKANIPTRIAFQVSQRVDSRTILDQQGAETLLGYGDMLFLPPGTGLPIRVHGAFVDDHEVDNVVSWIKQTGEPDYIEAIVQESLSGLPGLGGDDDASGGEADELYDQAVAVVTESRKASISYVQRRLKIGYNRAARMIEDMENAGVVSPPGSGGQREVLVAPPPPGG